MAWNEFNRSVIDHTSVFCWILASVVIFIMKMTVYVRCSSLLRVASKCHFCSPWKRLYRSVHSSHQTARFPRLVFGSLFFSHFPLCNLPYRLTGYCYLQDWGNCTGNILRFWNLVHTITNTSLWRQRFVIYAIYVLLPPTFLFLLISHHLLISFCFVARVRWLCVL